MRIAIDQVEIGTRYRSDLGDTDELAASMDKLGILQPIVLTPDGLLVAGERRLAAARSLGWAHIDAVVVDTLDDAAKLLTAERDENTCRKPFTPTEEHALYEALLEIERRDARNRQGERSDLEYLTSEKVSQKSGTERAREAAAEAATGKPGRHKTLDKVGEVKKLAEDESAPEEVWKSARDALADIDATGKVDGAYQRAKQAERDNSPEPAKSSPAKKSPPRKSLPDQFFNVTYDLGKVVDRLAKLAEDDRFPRNAEQVSTKHRGDLQRAADVIADVLTRLPNHQ